MKVAVVGSGIAGLAAAHRLAPHTTLTLFEAGSYFGGHTHTVDVHLPTARGDTVHGVDTGFLVYNDRTYPHLIQLFKELGVLSRKGKKTRLGFAYYRGAYVRALFKRIAGELQRTGNTDQIPELRRKKYAFHKTHQTILDRALLTHPPTPDPAASRQPRALPGIIELSSDDED